MKKGRRTLLMLCRRSLDHPRLSLLPQMMEAKGRKNLLLPGSSPPSPIEDMLLWATGRDRRSNSASYRSRSMAILVQLLTAFGNVIGASPHFWIGANRHYTNLFSCLVGRSSKGRKGMSLGYVREGFNIVDPDWISARGRSGASSGEGVIWAVRDPISKTEPVKENGKFTGKYTEVTIDQGVTDKRLFVVEDEFARCLAVMTRDNNTLSTVLRAAWDHIPLDTVVKNMPARAREAHISIVAHITLKELKDRLGECEFFNGFANRFLWLCVRRARCLPEPPNFSDLGSSAYFDEVKKVTLWAKEVCEMERSEKARKIWCDLYPELSAEAEGKFGSATARSEAQVVRLSMIYALSTGSRIIDIGAQEAALAFWKYCEGIGALSFRRRSHYA